MAKSTRSKVKRAYRAKKREDSVYAAIEAARLERLSSKLRAIREADKEGDVELADVIDEEDTPVPDQASLEDPTNPDSMQLDNSSLAPKPEKKVSTHGMRMSRRAEWRMSKGLPPRPKSRGMNRQGGIRAKSRAGRAQRRR
ncbi:hypothetical protein ACEPAI_6235 [Sanghuangporus weigelae]